MSHSRARPPNATETPDQSCTGVGSSRYRLQSCLAGTNLLSKLGLNLRHLSKTRLQMTAANGNNLDITGAIALRFSDSVSQGGIETRQIVYIWRDTSDSFLSCGACVELGIVPPDFPNGFQKRQSIAEVSAYNVAWGSSMTATCDCPRRQPPPLPPKDLPFPAVEGNREKLEQWLLSYYKASTFNTCHHQPLLPMEGPPLRLMIHPDAKPVACHTPIDVPINWCDDVKAGVDQDCKMGVIEWVQVGTHVTWCHRMVVCAKKNGNPRRTVDLHALNAYATRETHHTQRPFHQARSVPQGTKKTACDASNGYHAVPLHADDKHFTTVIGVAIGTARLFKDTWRPAMASHAGSMKSSPTYLTKQSALMMSYCGQTALTRPSGRLCGG